MWLTTVLISVTPPNVWYDHGTYLVVVGFRFSVGSGYMYLKGSLLMYAGVVLIPHEPFILPVVVVEPWFGWSQIAIQFSDKMKACHHTDSLCTHVPSSCVCVGYILFWVQLELNGTVEFMKPRSKHKLGMHKSNADPSFKAVKIGDGSSGFSSRRPVVRKLGESFNVETLTLSKHSQALVAKDLWYNSCKCCKVEVLGNGNRLWSRKILVSERSQFNQVRRSW